MNNIKVWEFGGQVLKQISQSWWWLYNYIHLPKLPELGLACLTQWIDHWPMD